MTQRKKAHLQRKLTGPPVPPPPADLAQRIKNDIPKHLLVNADSERARLSRSIAFNLRVAASILLLVSGVFVWIRFLVPGSKEGTTLERGRAAARQFTVPAAAPSRQKATEVAVADTASTATTQQARSNTAFEFQTFADADAKRDANVSQRIDAPKDARRGADPAVGGLTGAVAPPPAVAAAAPPMEQPAVADHVSEAMGEKAETTTVIASAPAVPESVPSPAAVAAAPPPPAAAPLPRLESAAGPRTEARDRMAMSKLASKESDDEVFGISVSRDAVARVTQAIESGRRPSASSVDVDALTNYFAGPPQTTAKNVSVETEGSPAPVAENEYCCVVRVTIDTPIAPGVVGTAARIDVALNPRVVKKHRRIGTDSSPSAEAELRGGISVTALYAVDLRDGVRDTDEIAAVTLTYRDSKSGEIKRLRGRVLAADLQRGWDEVSRRHRLATLGAVWGEELRSGETIASAVATRVQELVTQSPGDARARQLNQLISASSRLRTSAPTGSGR